MTLKCFFRGVARLAVALNLLCAAQSQAQIVVTTTADSGAGSLRAAISQATAGSTITFDPSLSGKTITLSSGQLSLTSSLNIDASSLPAGITISGNNKFRGFLISPGLSIRMDSLTITKGKAPPGALVGQPGGGICTESPLTLVNCRVLSNLTTRSDDGSGFGNGGLGGGIYSSASLILSNCTISANSTASGTGGGDAGNGAGIFCAADLTLLSSAVSSNTAAAGGVGGLAGGIYCSGNLVIANSTIAGNSSGGTSDGGGLYIEGVARLDHATLTGNKASGKGGGIHIQPAAKAALTACIVAGNTAQSGGADLQISPGATVTSGGGNLIGDNNSASDLFPPGLPNGGKNFVGTAANPVDPLLAQLSNYGGPTPTAPPRPGSPAIDNGGETILTGDQRGFARVIDGNRDQVLASDIGAVEFVPQPSAPSQPLTVATDNADEPVYSPKPLDAWTSVNGGSGFQSWSPISSATAGTSRMESISGGGRQVDGDYSFALSVGTETGSAIAYSRGLSAPIVAGVFEITTRFELDGAKTNAVNLRSGNDTALFGGGELISFGMIGGSQLGFADNYGFHPIPSGNARGGVWKWRVIFDTSSGLALLEVTNATSGFFYNVSATLKNNGAAVESFAVMNSSAGIDQTLIFDGPSFRVEAPTSTTVVTTSEDDGPGSLRQAIAGSKPGDIVTFAKPLSGKKITLLTPLTIGKNLGINGMGLDAGIVVSGGGKSRIFQIEPGVNFTLTSLTLTEGSSLGNGGAVENQGSLVVSNCTVSASSAASGGGIFNSGSFAAVNSTFSANHAAQTGGAVAGTGSITLNASTVSGNQAGLTGGGLSSSGVMTINNSIVAGNTAPSATEVNGTLTGSNNLLGGDPALQPLGSYGGLTQTMPPKPGSPSIDAGGDSNLATDQRGLPRLVGPSPDIGAVELDMGPVDVVVNNTGDAGPGSLRDAIRFYPVGSRIGFSPSLSGQTITLTSGALVMRKNASINAENLPGGLTISGGNASRVLEVSKNVTASVRSIKILNAKAPDGTNGAPGGNGGGIYNEGNLDLAGMIVSACTVGDGDSAGRGGGIFNSGTLKLVDSKVVNNVIALTASGGAGIENTGSMIIDRTEVSGNEARIFGFGGGIENIGDLEVRNSTISGNTSSYGAGLLSSGARSLAMRNSTIVSNTANFGTGGGIFNDSPLTIENCTIKGNSAPSNGGGVQNTGPLILNNTIITGNKSPGSANLSTTTAIIGGHNLTSGDALLSTLGLHGGSTPTMVPLQGSPAIDAGGDTALATDQRGLPRRSGSAVDIGAVEVDQTVTRFSSPVLNGGAFKLEFTAVSGTSPVVIGSTNITAPIAEWKVVGQAVETAAGSGIFRFEDTIQQTDGSQFYRVRVP